MAGELGHVVIEHHDPWVVGEHAAALRAARFSVRVCDGPAFRASGCPAVTEGRCELIDRADIIVHHLDADDPAAADVLAALRRSYLGTPVVTDLSTGDPDAAVEIVSAAAAYLHRPSSRR